MNDSLKHVLKLTKFVFKFVKAFIYVNLILSSKVKCFLFYKRLKWDIVHYCNLILSAIYGLRGEVDFLRI